MSRFEDEEEDELQMILEGRDVEDYREYNYYRQENNPSEQSKTNSDHYSDEDNKPQNKSLQSKKRKFDHNIIQTKDKRKPKISSSVDQLNSGIENEFRNEEHIPETNVNKNEANEEKVDKIKVKVRRTLKPQPKLNADRLNTNEGLPLLPQVFSDFKFSKKGSELKDLNAIMFRLSHWSHRLFPSLTFDDFIEKCEQLGHKKEVKTFVCKVRNDLPLNLIPNEAPLEEKDRPQNQDFDNDKDFDYVIANSFGNLKDNNEKTRESNQTNDSDFEVLKVEDQQIEQQSLPISGSQHKSNEDIVSEVNDEKINSVADKYINDSNDEELTEEQMLREINSDDETRN